MTHEWHKSGSSVAHLYVEKRSDIDSAENPSEFESQPGVASEIFMWNAHLLSLRSYYLYHTDET